MLACNMLYCMKHLIILLGFSLLISSCNKVPDMKSLSGTYESETERLILKPDGTGTAGNISSGDVIELEIDILWHVEGNYVVFKFAHADLSDAKAQKLLIEPVTQELVMEDTGSIFSKKDPADIQPKVLPTRPKETKNDAEDMLNKQADSVNTVVNTLKQWFLVLFEYDQEYGNLPKTFEELEAFASQEGYDGIPTSYDRAPYDGTVNAKFDIWYENGLMAEPPAPIMSTSEPLGVEVVVLMSDGTVKIIPASAFE